MATPFRDPVKHKKIVKFIVETQLLLTMCTMVNALLLVQPYVLCSSSSWSTSVDNVYHGECLALSSAICFMQFFLLVNFC